MVTTKITFKKLENDRGFYYIPTSTNSVYSITFKDAGGEITAYSRINTNSLSDLAFIESIKVPKGERSICFKVDVDDVVNLVLIANNEVENAYQLR